MAKHTVVPTHLGTSPVSRITRNFSFLQVVPEPVLEKFGTEKKVPLSVPEKLGTGTGNIWCRKYVMFKPSHSATYPIHKKSFFVGKKVPNLWTHRPDYLTHSIIDFGHLT